MKCNNNDRSWCNNILSKKLNEEYSRSFSYCDIDGIIRVNILEPVKCVRYLFIETKRLKEPTSQTQYETMRHLHYNFKWENFEEKSGTYFIRIIDDNFNLRVSKFEDTSYFCGDMFCEKYIEMTFDDFASEYCNAKKVVQDELVF